MGIINRLSTFRKKVITHVVDDGETKHEFKFYPPRWRNIASGKTRELIEPIVQAVLTLMTGGKNTTTQHIVYVDGVPAEASTMAQEPEVMKAVALAKRQAISDALGVLLNPMTSKSIGELLADSLREDFPAPTADDFEGVVEAFMEEVTTDVFLQLLVGYAKALMPFFTSSGNLTPSGLLEKARGLLGQGGVAEIVAEVAEENGISPTTAEAILNDKQKSTEESTKQPSS